MKNRPLLCYFFCILFSFGSASARSHNNLIATARDTLLTAQVKSALHNHPITKSADLDVETNGGNVYLSGHVESKTQANEAEIITKSIPGVRSVTMDEDALVIKHSRHPVTDSYITNEIKHRLAENRLLFNPKFTSLRINVETKNSKVYLSGNVVLPYQAEQAVTIARETEGVRKVYYNFTLKG